MANQRGKNPPKAPVPPSVEEPIVSNEGVPEVVPDEASDTATAIAPVEDQWIVILQKKPHGPLNEIEVRTLISQGHLRTNDLGFKINSNDQDPKTPTVWKLLWQFPEFDRRRDRKEGEGATKAPAPETPRPETIQNKRGTLTPEELKERSMADLPPEILNLTPEDLIPHATSRALGTPRQSEYESTDSSPSTFQTRDSSRKWNSGPWVFGIPLLIFIALGFWLIKGKVKKDEVVAAPAQPESREIATPPAHPGATSALPRTGLMPPRTMGQPPAAREPENRRAEPAPPQDEETGRIVEGRPEEEPPPQSAEEEQKAEAAAEAARENIARKNAAEGKPEISPDSVPGFETVEPAKPPASDDQGANDAADNFLGGDR